ncbi:YggS family pyridoxal phosphate-dependent enzyme [Buchnera aphidicola]|uniref:YggS family pyridoxal phosphate-dependent enzyme n=1 Tax=Buchnera aphidicola TaxID=9 RepID=UPI0031B8A261
MKNLKIKNKINKIKKNIKNIKKIIKKIIQNNHKNYKKIKLLIITKNQKYTIIKNIISKKNICFGENYIQESLKKIKKLNKYSNIKWHFIGNIQSNKIKFISKYFQWCHSVKKEKTAILLNKYRSSNYSPLKILIQISNKKIKNCTIKKIIKFIKKFYKKIKKLPKLKLKGIMLFPKINIPFSKIDKKIYKKCKKIIKILKKKNKHFTTFSFGTSRDFKKSILSGSTLIRIGKKIFN